jgi:dUTP pyrophosphatase
VEDTKEVEVYGEVIRCFGPGWINDDGLNINPVNKIDFKVKCSAKMYSNTNSNSYYTGYFLFPRSSISKTPLRLANSQGIIDSGYRGNLMGMFDIVNKNDEEKREYEYADYYVKKYDKLVQICAPCLCPIFVEIVDTLDELGDVTERGEKGFGSTSKNTFF